MNVSQDPTRSIDRLIDRQQPIECTAPYREADLARVLAQAAGAHREQHVQLPVARLLVDRKEDRGLGQGRVLDVMDGVGQVGSMCVWCRVVYVYLEYKNRLDAPMPLMRPRLPLLCSLVGSPAGRTE